MSINTSFIGELKHEASLTKKILERVPLDNKEWKPHEKSMTIGRLATHMAENMRWVAFISGSDVFDLSAAMVPPHTASTKEELLEIFQGHYDRAMSALEKVTDEDMNTLWTFTKGGQTVMQMPRKVAIRNMAFNHMVHHRGQLSVYLRLLDVPVPGMYGPSADEK
jgi:uncharacterized damage-inducible protein DinB